MEKSPFQSFREGPTEANFAPLFEATKKLVYTICRRVLGNHPEEIEDAFQGTYIRLLQQIHDGEASPNGAKTTGDDASVLGRLAYLEADRVRHKRARREAREVLVEIYPDSIDGGGRGDEAHEAMARREEREIVRDLVDQLPDSYRLPIQLYFFHGLTHREIAETMGLPIGTVSSRVRRGLALLEEPLKRAGLEGSVAVLTLMMTGAALWSPPASFTASSAFAAASAAILQGGAVVSAGATGAGAAEGGSAASLAGEAVAGSKFAATLAGAALLGAILVTGWMVWRGGANRPVPPPSASAIPVRATPAPAASAPPEAAAPAPAAAAPAPEPIPSRAASGRLGGRVYGPSGRGVAGLTVFLTRFQSGAREVLRRQAATTDAEGSYRFDSVDPGDLLVRVQVRDDYPFYPVETIWRSLQPGEEAMDVHFHLLRGATIAGDVVDDAGVPIPGAVVEAMLLLPDPWGDAENDVELMQRYSCPGAETEEARVRYRNKRATTDKRGYFEIAGIHPMAKVLQIESSAADYLPRTLQPTLPFDEQQEIRMKRAGGVRLVVREEVSRAPIARFRYRFSTDWRCKSAHDFVQWREPDSSESTGEVLVHGVPPGQWQAEVAELDAAGRETGRRAKALFNATMDEDVVTVCLGATRVLTGRVVGPDGEPVAGAEARLYPGYVDKVRMSVESGYYSRRGVDPSESAGAALGAAYTGPDGWFQIDGLSPGVYELAAVKDNWVNARRQAVAVPSEGAPEPVMLSLVESCRLTGRVIDGEGRPLAGAQICFVGDGGEPVLGGGLSRAVAGADGNYVVRDLRPDRYKVGLVGYADLYKDVTFQSGQECAVDFDLSGWTSLRGRVTVDGKPWKRGRFQLFLRPRESGYPTIWVPDTGFFLSPDAEDPTGYSVRCPPGRYFLWASYPDARVLLVGAVDMGPSPDEQRHDFAIQLADVSVVVLTEEGKPCDDGMVCFDQRFGDFVQSRVFSMNQKEEQGFFPDMPAGEYRVCFASTDSDLMGDSDWTRIEPGRDGVIVVELRPVEKGTAIGGWDPSTISQVYEDHDYPLPANLAVPGERRVTVLYEWGPQGVRIESVALVRIGVAVDRDVHEGWSGTGKKDHIYSLVLPPAPESSPGAATVTDPPAGSPSPNDVIRVRMRAEGGFSSRGTVYCK